MIKAPHLIQAPNFSGIEGLEHGFGLRDSLPPEGITTIRQIHSCQVLDAESANGQEGDALVSKTPGTLVGVKTADCVPILLIDPEQRIVAAIHAGWRGTAANITAATVRRMSERWGSKPGSVRAAIGPSIGVCCYEVGPDVARQFGTWIPDLRHAAGPLHLDLRRVNNLQLRQAGITDIWISGECTFCSADRFCSFRRERENAGRMLSFIGLQKTDRADPLKSARE